MPSNENTKYAPSAWASAEFDFTLPSGDVVLLNKLDPLTLVEHGLADKLDFATSAVMNVHSKNANLSPAQRVKRDRARREAKARGENPDAAEEAVVDQAAIKEIIKGSENSRAFREVLDQMLVLGVAAPEMHLPPEDKLEKVKGKFYTDAVPWEDKMAIFNVLMKGVRAAEQFREGSEEDLGDVAPEPIVRNTAKRAPRASQKRSSR